MENFQQDKAIVRAYQAALATCKGDATDTLADHVSADYLWRGFHPFDEISGAAAVAQRFWNPLRQALTSLTRREDVFFAGANHMDAGASNWVVSMGHLVGLFDQPWLGIRPTRKMAFLRYCEFHRIEQGKITETAMYFDIPHLMAQAGQSPFQGQTAAHLVQPGPATHDGILTEPQAPEAGHETLDLLHRMIGDLGQWQSGLPLEDELRQTWAEDMIWWGPEGIGATYTIERYAQQHSGPFRAAFSKRSKTTHVARLAEGHYAGFFGWPNFTATLSGDYMGRPATHKTGEFRVIDIYRRAGDRLAENWVFIDLLHFWKCQGADLLPPVTAPIG